MSRNYKIKQAEEKVLDTIVCDYCQKTFTVNALGVDIKQFIWDNYYWINNSQYTVRDCCSSCFLKALEEFVSCQKDGNSSNKFENIPIQFIKKILQETRKYLLCPNF
jgi:hypothetical protein